MIVPLGIFLSDAVCECVAFVLAWHTHKTHTHTKILLNGLVANEKRHTSFKAFTRFRAHRYLYARQQPDKRISVRDNRFRAN